MASVHEIGIASDTRAFEDGFKRGVIRPVEDSVKAFDKLEDAASDLGDASRDVDRLEDSLDDVKDSAKEAGTDGARSVDKLEEAMREAQRATERLDDSMGDVGDGGVRNLDRVKSGAQELQNEFGSNLGEAVSSFRGDLTDLGQTGQDTLGGLAATVSGMGPMGLAGAFVLAAGAAGLGLFTAGQEEAREKQEELNAAAAKWADAYVASAGRIVDAAYTVNEINAISTDPERYKEAKDAAKEWGVDVSVAMAAMAGDATALATAEQSLTTRTEQANRQLAEQEKQVDGNAGATYDLAESVQAGRERMDELNGVMSEGYDRAVNQAEALYLVATASGVATGEVDDLGNKIVKMPDGKEIVIDAETGQAYQDIDAIERKQLTDKQITIGAADGVTSVVDQIIRRNTGKTIRLGVDVGAAGRQLLQ